MRMPSPRRRGMGKSSHWPCSITAFWGTTSLGCLPDYISRGPRESCLRTYEPRGGRPRAPDPGSVVRGHRGIRMDGLSKYVRQTKDTYKRPCRTVVSTLRWVACEQGMETC